jgi:O-antigen/teichoic acid export membrane protein
MSDANDAIVHFVIGSSFFITIFPYLILFFAYKKLTPEEQKESKISLETMCLLLPFFFGISFAVSYRCLKIIPRKNGETYTRFIVCGGISAFIVSLIFDFVLNIQQGWLHMENTTMCHILIPIFYIIVFYTIGIWIRSHLIHGYGSGSTDTSSSLSSTYHTPGNQSSSSSKMYDMIQAKALSSKKN